MLVEVAEEQRKHFVSVKLVKDLLSITTNELAENMIMKVMKPHHLASAGNQSNPETQLYQPTNNYDYHPYDLNGNESKASVRKQSHSATCNLS